MTKKPKKKKPVPKPKKLKLKKLKLKKLKLKPKPTSKPMPMTMTTRQYLAALDNLGLTVAGKATAKALGLGVRHCQRIASGGVKVPVQVEKLLNLYLKHPDTLPQEESSG